MTEAPEHVSYLAWTDPQRVPADVRVGSPIQVEPREYGTIHAVKAFDGSPAPRTECGLLVFAEPPHGEWSDANPFHRCEDCAKTLGDDAAGG
jgi:hypothetical protein